MAVSIIITCDETKETLDLTKQYGVVSLKQAYFMLKNWEIPWREVQKVMNNFLHFKTDDD